MTDDISQLIQEKILQLEGVSPQDSQFILKHFQSAQSLVDKMLRQNNEINDPSDNESVKSVLLQYIEVIQENTRLLANVSRLSKSQAAIQRDRESIAMELERTQQSKLDLEDSCRRSKDELERLNEECERLRESQEVMQREFGRRVLELNASLKERHQQLLQSNNQTLSMMDKKETTTVSLSPAAGNESEELTVLREQFITFLDQYEARERYLQCTRHTKTLELQLAASKLFEQKQLADEASAQCAIYKQQADKAMRSETMMRKQLEDYRDQFKRIEETLQKNNELFIKFRSEMEEMSENVKRLEAENESLRSKFTAALSVPIPNPAAGRPLVAPPRSKTTSTAAPQSSTGAPQPAPRPMALRTGTPISAKPSTDSSQPPEKLKALENLSRTLVEERNKLQKTVDELREKLKYFEFIHSTGAFDYRPPSHPFIPHSSSKPRSPTKEPKPKPSSRKRSNSSPPLVDEALEVALSEKYLEMLQSLPPELQQKIAEVYYNAVGESTFGGLDKQMFVPFPASPLPPTTGSVGDGSSGDRLSGGASSTTSNSSSVPSLPLPPPPPTTKFWDGTPELLKKSLLNMIPDDFFGTKGAGKGRLPTVVPVESIQDGSMSVVQEQPQQQQLEQHANDVST